MRISHHPDDSNTVAYAAGALTEGFSLVLAAHLEYCPLCRDRLTDAQAFGGALLMDLQPTQQPASGLDDIWARIETGGGELMLILKGAYQDEVGYFRRGDLADPDPSMSHQPVASRDEPCICIIATDHPLRFSGIVSRMLQPFVGI